MIELVQCEGIWFEKENRILSLHTGISVPWQIFFSMNGLLNEQLFCLDEFLVIFFLCMLEIKE